MMLAPILVRHFQTEEQKKLLYNIGTSQKLFDSRIVTEEKEKLS